MLAEGAWGSARVEEKRSPYYLFRNLSVISFVLPWCLERSHSLPFTKRKVFRVVFCICLPPLFNSFSGALGPTSLIWPDRVKTDAGHSPKLWGASGKGYLLHKRSPKSRVDEKKFQPIRHAAGWSILPTESPHFWGRRGAGPWGVARPREAGEGGGVRCRGSRPFGALRSCFLLWVLPRRRAPRAWAGRRPLSSQCWSAAARGSPLRHRLSTADAWPSRVTRGVDALAGGRRASLAVSRCQTTTHASDAGKGAGGGGGAREVGVGRGERGRAEAVGGQGVWVLFLRDGPCWVVADLPKPVPGRQWMGVVVEVGDAEPLRKDRRRGERRQWRRGETESPRAACGDACAARRRVRNREPTALGGVWGYNFWSSSLMFCN